ncbi:MAG: queuosine precursor transporter [Spirochaetes bacterium]|nr:queuosine precursor transporter [Spirochaetota bacterium]
MHNILVYILWILTDLSLLLLAFTLWGKMGIIAIISSNVVIMNLFVLKGIVLFGMSATGGNVLYASIFLGTDIMTEYFGAKEARKAVFIGFFISVFFLIATQFILLFTPAEWDLYNDSMKLLFTPVWRVVGASMAAYIVAQNLDVMMYRWLKKKVPSQLWVRNNGSTWISQLADSIIFCLIAFIGKYALRVVLGIVLSTYLLKVLVAVIDTPFLYITRPIVRLRPRILE